MLQIQHIRKEYRTGKLVQKALDDVSLNLRDSEFVAVLGPSGSGKTTLLNIIGGLDRYDSGDVIINGISTKKYKDRDWDSYRNHTIGFVFQSYNLIPHQTVLSNVELALTISGISRTERRKRAKEALEKVGLGEQIHKKPSQMSGGQMQRVAIARALVNNPDILLADEPTGALDSETSVQVMELLKEVSKDRLVVMVTHNPELAYEYATRIVEVKDGKILSDSDPLEIDENIIEKPVHKNMGKSSMSFLTALSLSFQNLKTKKARTLLTSFAGSIGIIGIALILSISNGVSGYISAMEEDTLSEYPLQIQSTGFDLTAMMVGMSASGDNKKENDIGVTPVVSDMFSKMSTNDLASLKTYIEGNPENIEDYVHAIEYKYIVTPQIYREDNTGYRQINPDKSYEMMGMSSSYENSMTSGMSTNVFYELPSNSSLYEEQYEVKAGHWPQNYNECVLVLSSSGNISDRLEYTLGLRDNAEYENMISAFMSEKEIDIPENNDSFSYDDFIGMTFKVVNSADYYQYDTEYDIWKDKTGNEEYMKELISKGSDLKISGIVKQVEGTTAAMLTPGIAYTSGLTRQLIQYSTASDVVKAQKEKKDTNIFTGEKFGISSDSKSKFNMESLFQIDTDAISNVFKVDDSIYNMSMPDFAALINPDDISAAFDPSMFDSMDSSVFNPDSFGDISSAFWENGMDFDIGSIDADTLKKLVSDSLTDEVKASISEVLYGFKEYMSSEEVSAQLSKDIRQLITDSMHVNISQDRVLKEVNKLEARYLEYIKKNGIEDTTAESVFKFLLTDEARNQISDSAKELMNDAVTFDISKEQLWSIFKKDVVDGYAEYARQNGYQNIDGILDKVINNMMNSLQEQFAANIQNAMNKMMESIMGNMQQAMEAVMTQMMSSMTDAMMNTMRLMGNNMAAALGSMGMGTDTDDYDFSSAFGIDTDSFADAIKMNMNESDLSDLMKSLMSDTDVASYDNNMKKLGYADLSVPGEIDIYPKDFESKDKIVNILDNYNTSMKKQGKDEQVISYTDVVGTLMSSVTTIVNVISYVLIAFVAISLIVSSIMIGVITYISVLERRKEIGILRAIGASKKNVSAVFNAETCIIGLCSGLMGIGITLLFLLPINAVIHALSGVDNINAVLPVIPAIVLILLSVFLTFTGGLIPSKKASKSDPVTALRNE